MNPPEAWVVRDLSYVFCHENRRITDPGRSSEDNSLVTEGHAQLADDPVEVDAEVVCQA